MAKSIHDALHLRPTTDKYGELPEAHRKEIVTSVNNNSS